MPRFLLAIFTLEFIWSQKVKFPSVITPRPFSFFTFSNSICWLFDIMVYLVPLSCLPMCRWRHFMMLKSILQTSVQLTARFRLLWILFLSAWFDTTAFIFAPSSNNYISTSMTSGKSCIQYQEQYRAKNTTLGNITCYVFLRRVCIVYNYSLFTPLQKFSDPIINFAPYFIPM